MNTVKTAVGENDDDITGLTVLAESVEDGVGVGKSTGLGSQGTEISSKLNRRKLLNQRDGIQRYMLPNQDLVGVGKNTGVVVLKHGPPAGIGARFKDYH